MQNSMVVKTVQEHRNDLAVSVAHKCVSAYREFERTGNMREAEVWAQMEKWYERLRAHA